MPVVRQDAGKNWSAQVMWAVWLVTGTALALCLAVMVALRGDFRVATPGWKLLAVSGLSLALGGVGFAVRFWKPTAGPYHVNELYPLGPYLNTWAVSLGFAWLAFGFLFLGLALFGAQHPSWRLWWMLLVAWFVCWLPHGVIGIGFAWAGQNAPSVQLYRDWGSHWAGMLVLSTSSIELLVHFSCVLSGLLLTGRELRAGHDRTQQLRANDASA